MKKMVSCKNFQKVEYKPIMDQVSKDTHIEDRGVLKVSCEFIYRDESGKSGESGECFIYLYETALVVSTDFTSPVRIPYCIISSIEDGPCSVIVKTDSGEQYIFFRMGKQLDVLKNALIYGVKMEEN
jgi:hypothetical protein